MAKRIVALANRKGGVGKTTTAVNIAAAIAKKNNRVLLIDSDPQGNATRGLGADIAKNDIHLYQIMMGEEKDAAKAVKKVSDFLFVLPANTSLAAAEAELVKTADWETVLKRRIAPLKEEYDYIIIDCPPSLGTLTVNALTAATAVLIPMQCEYFAMEGLAQLYRAIVAIRKKLNNKLTIDGIVFTMFDGRNKLTHQVVEEVSRHFRKILYKTVIPRNVKLSEAPSHGCSIFDYEKNSKGAAAYMSLAEEFLSREKK